jgi:hypothetical protein
VRIRAALSRILPVALLVSAAVVVLPSQQALAKSDFTSKPFMGWSSWSVESSSRSGYGTNWLTESNIKNATDSVAAKLASAGYSYINVDAGWNATLGWSFHTDANGIADPDPARFPSGMASLAAYIHGKGLKAGLYIGAGLEKEAYDKNAPVAGSSTCHTQDVAVQPLTATNGWGSNWKIDYSKPCAQSYLNSIADKFASWGFDFIKVDGITQDNVPDIAAWSQAIDQSGRQMYLTASAWPIPQSIADSLKPYANGVRVDTDVECYCSTTSSWGSSVSARWNDLPGWLSHVAPNYWPDLDSMPINNNTGSGLQDGLSDTERQTVMNFWSMASAPLYVGGDVYFVDSKAVSVLTNPEVIAVDQSGRIPTQVNGGTLQIWKKQLPDGSTAVGVYNLGSGTSDINVSFASLGLSGTASVRDLASRTSLGTASGSWTASAVPAHGSRLITLTGATAGTGGSTGPITGIGGKCVDVNGAYSGDNAGITLWTCNGGANQSWTRSGSTFRSLGKCLNVSGGGTANNTLVVLYTCNGSAAQNWSAPGDGTLRNPASGRCLDAAGGGSADGTNLIIWDCGGGANQLWTYPS